MQFLGADAVRRRERLGTLARGDRPPERQLLLGVRPGHRGHVGGIQRLELHVVHPPVGGDDEVGHQLRRGRLHQDVRTLLAPAAARGFRDLPPHGVPGRQRHQLFARRQGQVGDLAGCGIDLVQRPFRPRIDLDRVHVAVGDRFQTGRCIRSVDPLRGVRVGRRRRVVRPGRGCHGLELTRERERGRHRDDFRVRFDDPGRRHGHRRGGAGRAAILDRRRMRTAGGNGGEQQGGNTVHHGWSPVTRSRDQWKSVM